MSNEGMLAEGYDRLFSSESDFLRPEVVAAFKDKIRQKRYGIVAFAFPCNSWSIARRAKGGGLGPLRGKGDDL